MAIPLATMEQLLRNKYAILQQQADAGTRDAATRALTGQAQANLDTVRAGLLPAESRSNIDLQTAQGGLFGAQAFLAREQGQIVGPESRARVRNMDAETTYIGSQNEDFRRRSLNPFGDNWGSMGPALRSVMGSGPASRPRFRSFNDIYNSVDGE